MSHRDTEAQRRAEVENVKGELSFNSKAQLSLNVPTRSCLCASVPLWLILPLPDDRADDCAGRHTDLVFERDEEAEVRERRLGLDLGLVARAGVDDLPELNELVVGRDGPQHVDLARGRLLQLVEARDDGR